jgi:hypothetical protein
MLMQRLLQHRLHAIALSFNPEDKLEIARAAMYKMRSPRCVDVPGMKWPGGWGSTVLITTPCQSGRGKVERDILFTFRWNPLRL